MLDRSDTEINTPRQPPTSLTLSIILSIFFHNVLNGTFLVGLMSRISEKEGLWYKRNASCSWRLLLRIMGQMRHKRPG